MRIELDGKNITCKDDLFEVLKIQINNDEFIGSNLDALYDVLRCQDIKVLIVIENIAELQMRLGAYSDKLIQLFEDVESENDNCKLVIS